MAIDRTSKITIYQHNHPGTKDLRSQFSGVEIKTGSEPGLLLIGSKNLPGLMPSPGDRIYDKDGVWWLVKSVGELNGSNWPLTCEREMKS